MEVIYKIPLIKETGSYSYNELQQELDEIMELTLNEYDVLNYEVPFIERDVRLYSVKKDAFESTMIAFYDENNTLSKITYKLNEYEKLVYINMENDDNCKIAYDEFAKENAKKMTEELSDVKEKAVRLFFDWFWDGEAVDYSVKIGLAEEVNGLLEKYDGDESVIDNSGDFSNKYYVPCDTDTFSVMLQCTEMDEKIFSDTVELMTEIITINLLDKLDKTEDFEVVAGEYD